MSLDLEALKALYGAETEAPLGWRGFVPALVAEVAALRAAAVELWECPDCAFAFDAYHTDRDGGHSCPVCAEARLEAEVERLRAELDELRVRHGDA